MKVIISGGGTGGHIFPAIAIANALKAMHKDVDVLFVGANGRMEMEKVPQAGYKIMGLPIAGFQRRLTWKNLLLPFKLIASMRKASKIVKVFKPDVVIGVGGYASGPMLKAAQRAKIPTILQEQNSYAGITNKMLAKNATAICVAYDGMQRFFPAEKINLTGNPVRKDIRSKEIAKDEARIYFGLDPYKKTILLFGGSLGAKTLNEAMKSNVELIAQRDDVQIIWQAGRNNFQTYENCSTASLKHVQCVSFLKEMDQAYAAADLVICRAGALTISELCIVGKASILVPSPHVAEDHQTMNAMALVNQHAALIVKDLDAEELLMEKAYSIIDSPKNIELLEAEIVKLGRPDAVEKIVKIINRVVEKK